jgi:uncharacterized protein (TIGR02118 family)
MGESDVFHTLFVVYRDPTAQLSEADLDPVRRAATRLRGLIAGSAFTPISVEGEHPFVKDGRGPPLVLQLDFDAAEDLDAAVCADGALAEIVSHGAMASLPGAVVGRQRMIGRRFAVPDPVFRLAPNARPCTFLVEYPGTTTDLAAWLDHYDAHHPPIMARFPGIREVSTFRPAPAGRDASPCELETSMQRNKVVFDSSAALVAALSSPAMAEMRADAAAFPPSSQRPTHHAMATHRLV